jgi:hypothetical protein
MVIREMQIKIIMRNIYKPTRIAIIHKMTIPNVARCQGLMPVLLATQEAEIKRIKV